MTTAPEEHYESWLSRHLAIVLLAIGGLGVIIAAIALFAYTQYFHNPVSSDHGAWGEFGDFFGGTLNPIFGLFGLIAILLTLWVQSRELAISRNELRITREQLKRSAEAQERSEVALARQAALQEVGLLSTAAELKITALQSSIRAIDYESLQWVEGARARYADQVRAIVAQMDALILELEEHITRARGLGG